MAAWILLLLVRFYITFLSPFFGGACRFHPSCSNYAAEAISRHGARHGFSLAIRRLLRCNPFTKGGFDPVPDGVRDEVPNRVLDEVPNGVPCAAAAHSPRTQGDPQ